MQITRLELKDFRNIREAAVSFCPGVNVICGENAQGKTNLLEAVALLTGRGSFRGARESQMTRFGEKAFHLKMAFRDAEREQSIAYDAGGDKRKVSLNRVPLPSASELAGVFTAVPGGPLAGKRGARRAAGFSGRRHQPVKTRLRAVYRPV